MEGLLGILVGMVVLLSTMTNLFKKFTDEAEGGAGEKQSGGKGKEAERREIDRRIEDSFKRLFQGKEAGTPVPPFERGDISRTGEDLTAEDIPESGDAAGSVSETEPTTTMPPAYSTGERESVISGSREGTGRRARSAGNSARDRKKKARGFAGALTGQDLIRDEDDLLRGVIFKEILDRPRAQRPYRPPYSRQ